MTCPLNGLRRQLQALAAQLDTIHGDTSWTGRQEMLEASRLLGKCWDLSDAYEQLPLSDHAFQHDAFLVLFDPTIQKPRVYQQRVLPFGSVASVTAFFRLSLSLWKLCTFLMWSSYCDDFLSLAEEGLERHTDMTVSFLLSILGLKL